MALMLYLVGRQEGRVRSLHKLFKLFVACDVPLKFKLMWWRYELDFPHPVGIVIHEDVVIERGCTIFQGVTLGTKGDGGSGGFPVVKSGSVLYDGVKVYGGFVVWGRVKAGRVFVGT